VGRRPDARRGRIRCPGRSELARARQPDTRGLIHENDIQALKGWREIIDREFKTNIALHAKTKASSHRGDLNIFTSANTTDGNNGTYWTTNDDITRGSIEIYLDKADTLNYLVLQEYIKLGQRVKSFTVDAWIANAWTPVTKGTTIGYKRILRMDGIKTNKLRINIAEAKACPLISSIEVF
jgi:alpha-L-fucosidase